MEELVRIEAKVAEAAEAAADAAAHAVEATKAAEAARVARAAKKARPPRRKAAKAAKAAKSKAGKAARQGQGSHRNDDSGRAAQAPTETPEPRHVLELRLTDDELDQIERLAAEQDLPVPDLARTLLVRALNRSLKS